MKRLGAFTLGVVVAEIAACSVVDKGDYTFNEGGGNNEGGGANGASGGSSANGGGGEAGADTGSGGSAGGGKGGSAGQGGSGPVAGSGPTAGSGPIAGSAGTMPVDPCDPNPCQNDAECSVEEGRYYCRCPAGFEGLRCQVNLDDCGDMPCQNGGTCVDGANTYTCDCPDGFEGDACEIVSDPCEVNPCQNGGRCSVTATGTVCGCDTGWEGELCEINHDDCERNPCLNDGTCVDELNGYKCACQVGWEGELCEVPVDDCPGENPCQHGGACRDSGAGYVCVCNGYSGLNCETPRVLLIHDGMPDGIEYLLRSSGIEVTVTEIESEYDADPDPPLGHCAVVHLNGRTYDAAMPVPGQHALRYYVEAGGGYVGSAWSGYEVSKGTMIDMPELSLIPYANGASGAYDYTLTDLGLSHPVTQGLPETFSVTAGFTAGSCAMGGGEVLAVMGMTSDAVCVSTFGAGRIVDFNHAGYWEYQGATPYRPFDNPYVQQLLVQAVNWACDR